jgi:hypothetical protein
MEAARSKMLETTYRYYGVTSHKAVIIRFLGHISARSADHSGRAL